MSSTTSSVDEKKKEVVIISSSEGSLRFDKLLRYGDGLDWSLMVLGSLGSILGHFLSCVATFLCGILIAGICCWEVAILSLLVVPMILAIGATYTNKMNTISIAKIIFQSQATSLTISQIKTVYAFVGENSAIKSFSERLEQQVMVSKGEALIKGVGTGLFQTVSFCSWALIIWIGAVLVTQNKAKDMQIFNQAKVAGYEVFQVIQRKPTISSDSSQGKTLGKVCGNIEICDVFFSYPSRPEKQILEGFSLSIPAGKTVALVGSSGCGKRKVLIDDHNIKDLDLKFLRSNIGIVSQEPSLFTGTIKDNIKVGDMDANDQQIQIAAEMANAHSYISQLPNQYSTQVGQRGVQLSGGQKQRVAIARAILKNPPILLLDEATSALDTESEKLVQDAVEKAMQGRTVILIAHRLSTIVNADMIAVVENGHVTEIGTHRGLLDSSEFYNNLFNMQNLNPILESKSENSCEEDESCQNHKSFQNDIEENKTVTESVHPVLENSKQEESERGRKRTTFLRIWFGLRKRELTKIGLGSVAAAFSGISKPVFGYYIITIGVAYYHNDARRKVGLYSLLFFVIGLLSLFSHTLQHYFFGIVGEKAMANLRRALYSGVLNNEVAWFEKPENSVGSLTSRVISDTTMVKTIIADRMSVIVQCISSILIATIVSMYVNWRMGLVAWAVMPCHFIGGLIQAKSAKGFSGDLASSYSELVALAVESSTNIRTVASFCYEENILSKAKMSLENPIKKSRKQSIKYGLIQGFSLCLWNIAHAVALWYTTVLIDRRQAKFEDGIRSYQIFSLTVPSITELWTLIPTVISAISVLTPAYQTLDRKTEINPNTPEPSNRDLIKGKIEFQHVKFNYPLRPEVTVLNNFSLEIEAGSKVALVGPSGAGKSSILALLLRFYDSIEGNILIDGKEIKEYNLRWLRTQIGLVQQEPLLFSSSIRSNICYGTNEATETEIVEASRQANIHEFVSTLPNGYDTVVGEKGCQLSGGQKQRVAIARTLLKRPAIMLLDEATSALDAESEKSIVNALESMNLNGDRMSCITQITVAHRLSTIKNSDTIVVMDKGEIVEMGSHSSLLESKGLYSRLSRLQSFSGH
ncbi:hypothetical protein G4B88_023507 [Cannabis sativa]|uniref:Uncharacterized protein n=1 Tax=Cannabis sativa TaxID=3483 RepID=A0A7J6HUL2_CANSA|nr:hypothetical protein G4B88_023507 [Cannabis sativa]